MYTERILTFLSELLKFLKVQRHLLS